jgi:hypothetical protein
MVSSVRKREQRLVFDHLSALRIGLVILIVSALTMSCRAPERSKVLLTSIREGDCTAPPQEIAAPYAARDLGVQQCPAPRNWRALLVSSDANTWIEVAGPGVTGSGERPIVYESPIGNFASVDSSPGIEWRLDATERPVAMVFKVTAQNPQNLDTRRSMFYAVQLTESAGCVVGHVATIDKARALVQSSPSCPDPRPR